MLTPLIGPGPGLTGVEGEGESGSTILREGADFDAAAAASSALRAARSSILWFTDSRVLVRVSLTIAAKPLFRALA